MGLCEFFKNKIEKFKKICLPFKKSENKDIAETKTDTDTRPCKRPFEYFEIQKDGDVYPCPREFLKYKTSAGNIGRHSFNEIWNGKILTDLRKKMINGDFSMCDRTGGCIYEPYTDGMIPEGYEKGPKELKICYDYECNNNCITCRDMIKINTPEEMELYDEVYLPKVLEIAKNSETVSLSLSGEPLFARHSKHLIQELMNKYPNIKFNLFTNGMLLNEEYLTKLGIRNNINGLSVSVDAATRETYKQIHRQDAFDTVVKNLELMSDWKKQCKINWITINFVVHLLNYKEMVDFVKMAQKFDVVAYFSPYRLWNSGEFSHRYNEVAVFEPSNKHYDEFTKVLHNPVLGDIKHCYIEPCLLQNIMNN